MQRLAEPLLESLLEYLAGQEQFVFLDTSRPDVENSKSLLFLNPIRRHRCRAGDSLDDYLAVLQQELGEGKYLAGWIGYEFGALLEGGIRDGGAQLSCKNVVLADLGVFLEPAFFDHRSGKGNFPEMTDGRSLPGDKCSISGLKPNMEKSEFLASLARIKEYIAAGDTYQVNYTMKLLFNLNGSVERLYTLLRKNQSVGYGSFLRNKDESILSFSPELFFRKRGGEIIARPMKGTLERGRNGKEEQKNSDFLRNDSKNRSENVMIVDLLRNDLGRLVHGGGKGVVEVDSLFDIESYESLLQMTSTVKAAVSAEQVEELPLTRIFRALFPCGSITGAPKIRTMQIIDELEKDHRGVYTGAIGYFAPGGEAVFSVPIRTIRLKGERGEMGIGGGITHDSVAEEEWQEALLKGRFLTHAAPDFDLLETIYFCREKGYDLLEFHLDRLFEAARFFKFSYDKEKICKALGAFGKELAHAPCRVRLLLKKDGRVELAAKPCLKMEKRGIRERDLVEVGLDLPEVAIYKEPIDTTTPFVFHKTTNRKIYDEVYRKASCQDLYDYLLCNSKGLVTEGCITNLFIYKDGVLFTPPVEDGLLAGVMRQWLLENSEIEIREQSLMAEDLQLAEALFVCNSVRGLVRVKLRQDED